MSATTDMGSSPCNYFCQFNGTQTLCLGCFRSKEELKNWTHLNDREKGELMSVAAKRMHSYIAVNLMRANFDFPIVEVNEE
ncbi:MAG: DUF1289 domain-containing protein [Methylococcaceae bacterium]|nr:DUF1289 domain-containing protein [Methylococcaceae bacterium]